MKFPNLKIIDTVENKTGSDEKELLLIKIDWSDIDNHKIEARKNWYKKWGVPNKTEEQSVALDQMLDEVDWNGEYLYPSKYTYIYKKYSEFLISKSYYEECLHLIKMATEEWNRKRPFDTNVRESLLEGAIKFVELFFYLICDAIYIYNANLHLNTVPPNLPTTNQKDDVYFEHSVLLRSLMLFRFWKFQTGGGLLVDKSSEFIKRYNDSIVDKFNSEVKQDLIDNVKFEPFGLSSHYIIGKEEMLLSLVNQRVRDNRISKIVNER